MGISNCSLQIADHRHLPVGDGIADVVVAGWTICHLVDDNLQDWRTELAKVFFELDRVLRSRGTMIILETLGTGFETPHPPDHLRDYYQVLEKELGFTKHWIRTDYRFETLQETEQLSSFFFRDELAERVVEEGLMILPEGTGVWVNMKDIKSKPDEIR